jgi:hypothetical protein
VNYAMLQGIRTMSYDVFFIENKILR